MIKLKRWIAILSAVLVLGGCSAQPQSPDRLTQEIVPEDLPSSGAPSSSASDPGGSAASQGEGYRAESYDQAFGDLCRVKAELDALDLDEDMLEADYRVGKVGEEDFRTRKLSLKAEEDRLELLEDQVKREVRSLRALSQPPSGTLEELLLELRELEIQEDALELAEDQLERRYLHGEVDREGFLKEQEEIIRQDEVLDERMDLLEDALELLGWDD